jgi:hypothetical protein
LQGKFFYALLLVKNNYFVALFNVPARCLHQSYTYPWYITHGGHKHAINQHTANAVAKSPQVAIGITYTHGGYFTIGFKAAVTVIAKVSLAATFFTCDTVVFSVATGLKPAIVALARPHQRHKGQYPASPYRTARLASA